MKRYLIVLVLFTIGLSVAIPSAYAAAPSQPTIKVNTISTSQVDVYWTDNGTPTYHILNVTSTDGGSRAVLISDTSLLNEEKYSYTGLNADTKYTFSLALANGDGVSAVSAAVSNYTLPNAPTLLKATTTGGDTIKLTWGALGAGQNVTSYQIDRSPRASGSFTTITSATGDPTPLYNSTGLVPGIKYFYKIYALNDRILLGGTSSASSTVNAITAIAPSGTPNTDTPPYLKSLSINSESIVGLDYKEYSKLTDFQVDKSYEIKTGTPIKFSIIVDDEDGFNDLRGAGLYLDWKDEKLDYTSILEHMQTNPILPLSQTPKLTYIIHDDKISHTYVEWGSSGSTLYSSNDVVSDFDVTTNDVNSEITFTMTFSKPIDLTDILVELYSDTKTKNIVRDVLSINSDELPQTGTMSGSGDSGMMYDEQVVMSVIDKWAGYDIDSATDSDMLTSIGIKGSDIPNWVTNVAEWVHDEKLDMMDLINAISYLKNSGIIK